MEARRRAAEEALLAKEGESVKCHCTIGAVLARTRKSR